MDNKKEEKEYHDKLSQLLGIRMMEQAMSKLPPQNMPTTILNDEKAAGDYFQINARIGTNKYNINIKAVEDYNIAYKLLDVFLGILQQKQK